VKTVEKQYLTADIRENISSVIVGKEEVITFLLTCLVAGGHALLEDVPGTGKTVMAKSLAGSLKAEFSRIQFTPDLLPSDVVGLNYFNQKVGEFVLKKGPVFGNIVLADEINRATPRTQSSLLECMEEHQITIDGQTQKLKEPFIVLATQNPVETAGTFPLPEAQLDRFLMKLSMGLPSKEEEVAIMDRFLNDTYATTRVKELTSVCSCEEIVTMQEEASSVYVHKLLREYIADLVQATRKSNAIKLGVSPRGTLAMLRASKAFAYIQGRSYVVPEDIKSLAVPVFAHRLVMASGFSGEAGKRKAIEEILAIVPVPTEEWGK
jgi:MoxR-like ATPase